MKSVKPSDWDIHRQSCRRCASVNITETASLAGACFVGTGHLRDSLAKSAFKGRPRDCRDPDEKKIPQYVVKERYTATVINKKTKEPEVVEKEKTISPVYTRPDVAAEFLTIAKKTMGGDASRFFIAQR